MINSSKRPSTMPRGAPRCLRQCHSPDTLAPSQRSRSPDARVARDIVLSLSLTCWLDRRLPLLCCTRSLPDEDLVVVPAGADGIGDLLPVEGQGRMRMN